MTKFIAGMGFLVIGIVLLIPFNKVTGFIPSFSKNTYSSVNPTKAQVDSAFNLLVDEFLVSIDSLFALNQVPGMAISIVKDGEVVENRVCLQKHRLIPHLIY